MNSLSQIKIYLDNISWDLLCVFCEKSPIFRGIFVVSSVKFDTDQLVLNHMLSHRRRPQTSHTPAPKLQELVSINTFV